MGGGRSKLELEIRWRKHRSDWRDCWIWGWKRATSQEMQEVSRIWKKRQNRFSIASRGNSTQWTLYFSQGDFQLSSLIINLCYSKHKYVLLVCSNLIERQWKVIQILMAFSTVVRPMVLYHPLLVDLKLTHIFVNNSFINFSLFIPLSIPPDFC